MPGVCTSGPCTPCMAPTFQRAQLMPVVTNRGKGKCDLVQAGAGLVQVSKAGPQLQ